MLLRPTDEGTEGRSDQVQMCAFILLTVQNRNHRLSGQHHHNCLHQWIPLKSQCVHLWAEQMERI